MDYLPIVSVEGHRTLSMTNCGIGEHRVLEAQYIEPEIPKDFPALERKVVTDTDWSILKPLVYHLYMRDKLTFSKVKDALNELGYSIT